MSITMQGSWTVSVKSKNADFPQRFIIAGASSGNGTYAGAMSTPPVFVSGASWSITIQNNPGKGFVDSDDQIKFPSISGGQYRFDIESNDAGGDQDFNDLILTCSTPVTATDFILFGNVSCYSGRCYINPCFWPWIVIDTPIALEEALKNPLLKISIEKLYPDRLKTKPPRIGPIPDPPPFKPLVIPWQESSALPGRQAQLFSVTEDVQQAEEKRSKTRSNVQAETKQNVSALRTVSLNKSASLALDFDRVGLGRLFDRLIPFCVTKKMPGVVLKFQEYDRTNSELAGGAYTGDGNRENLGLCVTDRNGNFIFRFTRSISDLIDEIGIDTGAGEDIAVQVLPDIIIQVLDPAAPTGVFYESAPFFNIPLFKKINLCIPYCKRLPTACQGENAIQAIGNIFIGQPQSDGSRVGFNNFLGSEGRITAKNTLINVPQARCAAWAGNLDFFACFIDQPAVTQYTIRFRKLGESGWNFFQQEYRHPKIANIGIPGYNGDLIGPFDRMLNIDSGPLISAKAYDNIESNNAFVLTLRDRKAVISSWLYAPIPAPVQFRIEGYNSSGAKVAGADDTITLFIDNTSPDLDIDSVTMLAQTGGDCALFTLPPAQLNAPLTVKFKANQLQGFMNEYNLTVRKGNTSSFAIASTGPGLIQQSYAHGDDLLCNSLVGTFDDPVSDGFGYVITNVVPGSGNWLTDEQQFCTFAINVSCSTRVTNGYNSAINSYGPEQYLLGIQK